MTRRMTIGTWLVAGFALGGMLRCSQAEDPPKAAAPGTLTVVDNAGKEQKLKTWRFTVGTRQLGWLAPNKGEGAKAQSPDALAFREEDSTKFVDGVLTLVPLDRVRAIDYDDKEGVTLRVRT